MMYCPKCCKLVAEEKHVFGDRTEYRCPHCGHKIEVVHKPFVEIERQYSTGTV